MTLFWPLVKGKNTPVHFHSQSTWLSDWSGIRFLPFFPVLCLCVIKDNVMRRETLQLSRNEPVLFPFVSWQRWYGSLSLLSMKIRWIYKNIYFPWAKVSVPCMVCHAEGNREMYLCCSVYTNTKHTLPRSWKMKCDDCSVIRSQSRTFFPTVRIQKLIRGCERG